MKIEPGLVKKESVKEPENRRRKQSAALTQVCLQELLKEHFPGQPKKKDYTHECWEFVLTANVEFFVDPCAHDGGTAIGSCVKNTFYREKEYSV